MNISPVSSIGYKSNIPAVRFGAAAQTNTQAAPQEKPDNTKRNILIGAGIIAGVVTLGILAKKGKLGEGLKGFMDKIFKPASEKFAGKTTAIEVETLTADKVREVAKQMKPGEGEAYYLLNITKISELAPIDTSALPKAKQGNLFALATMKPNDKAVSDFRIFDCKSTDFTGELAEAMNNKGVSHLV